MKKRDLIVMLLSVGCLSACGKNIPVQSVSSNTYLSAILSLYAPHLYS